MTKRKGKKKRPSGAFVLLPHVVGDGAYVPDRIVRRMNTARKNAARLRASPTDAERRLEEILSSVNKGVLKGRFATQWTCADKWILDFFFYENRLAIEVDGPIHNTPEQSARDREKEVMCDAWDITLIRVTNQQVFGPRENFLQVIRVGWKRANAKIENSRFALNSPGARTKR